MPGFCIDACIDNIVIHVDVDFAPAGHPVFEAHGIRKVDSCEKPQDGITALIAAVKRLDPKDIFCIGRQPGDGGGCTGRGRQGRPARIIRLLVLPGIAGYRGMRAFGRAPGESGGIVSGIGQGQGGRIAARIGNEVELDIVPHRQITRSRKRCIDIDGAFACRTAQFVVSIMISERIP